MNKGLITISEIFGPTIQGEGALTGRSTVFVRTGGCDYECNFCDSLHAVAASRFRGAWAKMDAERVMRHVAELSGYSPCLVTLSGGNPAIQPLAPLIELGHRYGYTFAMETQGSISQPWFSHLDHLILSPKPPSSGMEFRAQRLNQCINEAQIFYVGSGRSTSTSLKVVVMGEDDYQFARSIYRAFALPNSIPFYITPGNERPPAGARCNPDEKPFDLAAVIERTLWILDRAKADKWHDVSITPQLHTFLWGNQQGV